MADTTSSAQLDALLAAFQAAQTKPEVSKPSIPIDYTLAQHSYESDAAQRLATEATKQLTLTFTQYLNHYGSITKKQLKNVFDDYQTKIDKYATFDKVAAQNLEGSITGKTQEPATTKITQDANYPDQVDQAKTLKLDANGKPILDAKGGFTYNTTATKKDTTLDSAVAATSPEGIAAQKKLQDAANLAKTTAAATAATATAKAKQLATDKAAGIPQSQGEAWAKFKKDYANEAAVIASDPDLMAIFSKALNNKGAILTDSAWQQLYEGSRYYTSHTSAFRDSQEAKLGNGKGNWVASYNKALQDTQDLITKWGINIDPALLGQTADNPTGRLVLDANGQIVTERGGVPYQPDTKNPPIPEWVLQNYYSTGVSPNATAIGNYLSHKSKIDPINMGGNFAVNVNQLKAYANDLGLNNLLLKGGSNFFTDAAKAINDGIPGANIDFYYGQLKNQAAAAFPKYAAQIQAGISLRSMAAPYINTAANLLETTADKIDLSSTTGVGAKVAAALQGDGTTTDFATAIRNDPTLGWDKTLNATDTAAAMMHQVGKDWGFVS